MVYLGFETFSETFDYCREANHPIQAVITGEIVWKLYKFYPSGRFDFIRVVQKIEGLTEQKKILLSKLEEYLDKFKLSHVHDANGWDCSERCPHQLMVLKNEQFVKQLVEVK